MTSILHVDSAQLRGGYGRGIAFHIDEDGFLTSESACWTRRTLTSVYVVGCMGSLNVIAQVQRPAVADHEHHFATIATTVLCAIFKVIGKHIGILPQAQLIFSHIAVTILLSDEQEDETNEESSRGNGNDGNDTAVDPVGFFGPNGATNRCSTTISAVFRLPVWVELGRDFMLAIGVPTIRVCALSNLVKIADLQVEKKDESRKRGSEMSIALDIALTQGF